MPVPFSLGSDASSGSWSLDKLGMTELFFEVMATSGMWQAQVGIRIGNGEGLEIRGKVVSWMRF